MFAHLLGNFISMAEKLTGSDSDYVHTMPAHFENGEKCDGSEI